MSYEDYIAEYKANLKKIFSLGSLTPEYLEACNRLADLEESNPDFAEMVESEL